MPRPFFMMALRIPISWSAAIDEVLIAADEALRALSGAATAARPAPGATDPGPQSLRDRRISAGLMRVNHSGEICAQALYSGQALVARDPRVKAALQAAGAEERDHLAWCRERLGELQSRPSLLDPMWYAGSLAFGVASGLAGDRWSMGFLAETEAQVERHLDGHLEELPPDDRRSRAILEQMRQDENRHGATGKALGAAPLPLPVRFAMRLTSQVMTHTAYWI
ncbi:MAG TPA: 2-polyprenyl-3-methyl-6-methoxy-1,4-benzoquinone monooxygenase [Usitatibacter sp.]|nr:2-polyprenyl-3-methyl-6-methoxy-1,4-benzoquinone monooxygenase [Usitatibacter sp.]